MERIKIAFITFYLGYGGAEKSLYYLIKLMDKSKFDITVFSILAGGEMEQDFKALGVKVKNPYSCSISNNNPISKTVNHLLIKRIESMVKSNSAHLLKAAAGEEFDIVVSYHVDSSCYGAGFPKKGKRIKYIHADLANSLSYLNDNRYLFGLETLYDKVICVSSIAQAGYQKHFGYSDSTDVLLNPLDSDAINILANAYTPVFLKDSYVCALGRLTKEKGFARLIEVYRKLRDKSFYPKLVIMGDGPEMELLKKMIREQQLEESVLLMGYQSNPYPVIKNSRFLIVPSYSEGLSMTAMEAVCLSVPVVSTCPSVGDIFGDEPCGIITENSDEALYQGMLKMCEDSFYRDAKQAVERRSKYFDGKKMAERVEKVYLDMLRNH